MAVFPEKGSLSLSKEVLSQWFLPHEVLHVTEMNAGQSGSTVVRICARPSTSKNGISQSDDLESADQPCFALKSFSSGSTPERVVWLHELLLTIGLHHKRLVPQPIKTLDGRSFVRDSRGMLWELCEWMQGTAVASPSHAQCVAGAESLASFHLSAALYSKPFPGSDGSLGIVRRQNQIQKLFADSDRWDRFAAHANSEQQAIASLAHDAATILRSCTRSEINRFVLLKGVELWSSPQAVWRDIWSDHMLFQEDVVCGIIDHHAAGIDTVAADIARLFGSWIGATNDESPEAWSVMLEAYASRRPLTSRERSLVCLYDSSGVMLGLDHWFRWTLDENRLFPNWAFVLSRIQKSISRLPSAIEVLSRSQ